MSIRDLYTIYDEKYDQYSIDKDLDGLQASDRLATIEAFLFFIEHFDPKVDKAYLNNVWYDSDDGWTILMQAVYCGKLEFVSFLVEAGADVNIIGEVGSNFALCCAAESGWQEIFDYLYPLTREELRKMADKRLKQGLKFRRRQQRHLSEIFVSAARNGNIKMLNAVILLGIDANSTNSKGEVAIHEACYQGNLEIVQALLEAGADMNLQVKHETPLSVAQKANQLEVINFLMSRGAE